MQTKIKVFLITLLVFLYCNNVWAKKEVIDSINDCNKLEFFNQKAICITDKIVSSEDISTQEQLFVFLMDYWNNKDGSMGFVISNSFIEILEKKPCLFFKQMNKYPIEFNEWLKLLPTLSFTWYDSSPSPYPAKKERIVKFLKNYDTKNSELEKIKAQLLNRMESIVPDQVE